MTVLLFFVMCLLAAITFFVKREYKIAIIFLIAIIGIVLTFLWYFTRLPYSLNLKHTPKIQFVQIRNATTEEIKYFPNDINHSLYIVEFSANMKLGKDQRSQYRFYCSPTEQEFDYDSIIRDSNKVFFVSDDVTLANETDSIFRYYAPIQFLSLSLDSNNLSNRSIIQLKDIKTNLRCKLFFMGMLQPILSTSEMIIPIDSVAKLLY